MSLPSTPCFQFYEFVLSIVELGRFPQGSLAAPTRGVAVMPLVLAGLLGVSQPTSAADGRLVNLSTRALVESGEEVMIGGFIIEDGARQVLIQAKGPELVNEGISDVLADPVLTVIQTSEGEPPRAILDPPVDLMVNDNWEDSQGQLVSDLWGGNPTLAPGSLSSAAVLTLDSGAYTAKVEGKDGAAGVAIIEVYGIDSPGSRNLDLNVLSALYKATAGANWRRSDNWGTNAPLDQWYGVKVDEKDRVIELNLFANGLGGAIPAELGNLTNLQRLELYENQLFGPIPKELGNLANLQLLGLSANKLIGPIPAELGNLTNLQFLWLSRNGLSGSLPAELGNLNKLEWLNLGKNQFSGPIPVELGKLTYLQRLGLQENQLTGQIPGELGNLANLEELQLNNNQLGGPIPTDLSELSKLERLYLWENQLTGPIPEELGNLANLKELWLENNQLSGPLPAGLGNLANLEKLRLHNNQLSGAIPAELGRLTNLESLSFSRNQLSGPIPAELGDLANLQFLYLSYNRLSGPIPAELGDLANLQHLWLSGNLFSGPIPAELGNLTNLEAIYLGGNDFSGCIPNGLRDVPESDLSMVGLPYCGTVSSDRAALITLYNATDGPNWTNSANWLTDAPLGDWEGIRTDATTGRVVGLDLAGNNLTGPIPAELGNLTNLEAIYLGGNDFSGCIPNGLRDVPVGDLSMVGLPNCGTVFSDRAALVALYNATDGPNWTNSANWLTNSPLGAWEGIRTDVTTGRVVRIFLPRNNLTGLIPTELGNLAYLKELWLFSNQLSGPIPPELGNLANLQFLALDKNQLSGPIPVELGNLANLEWFWLYGNQLSGPIPVELGNLVNLRGLWLYDNRLSGPIPVELANLGNLRWLHLGDNELSGCIPDELRGVGNNDFSETGLLFCGALEVPDLVVQSPMVSDNSPSAGDSFRLSVALRNLGGEESAATTLRYYGSADATITHTDTEIGMDAVGPLATLGTSDQSIELTAPSMAGTYYYGACVDAVPEEFDTTNNCSSSVQVDVQ